MSDIADGIRLDNLRGEIIALRAENAKLREIVLEAARRVAVYFDEYLPDDVSCNRASRDAERIARNVAEEKGVTI